MLQNLFSSKYRFSSDLFATAKQHIAKIIQMHALHKTILRWTGDKLTRIYSDSLVLRRLRRLTGHIAKSSDTFNNIQIITLADSLSDNPADIKM